MKACALQFTEHEDAEWSSGDDREPDYCSYNGAEALKEMIEAYWAARGQHVFISLQNSGFHPAIRAARFDVRSDMVNGKPRSLTNIRKPATVCEDDFDQEDALGELD